MRKLDEMEDYRKADFAILKIQSIYMQFTLYYRGPLKSNGKPKDKHVLRQHFHKQLKELWQQLPLSDYRILLEPLDSPKAQELSLIETVGRFTFAPLVSENISLVAQIKLTILWPQPPGLIFTAGGDIDNRLKTLLDALKVPSEPTALPKDAHPGDDEKPFFCLLQDDSLISQIDIETDQLLEATENSKEVVLLIRVTTRSLRATHLNL